MKTNGAPKLVSRSMKKNRTRWVEHEKWDKNTKAQKDLADHKGNGSCGLKSWLSKPVSMTAVLQLQCYKKNKRYSNKEKKYLLYFGHRDNDLLQGAALTMTNSAKWWSYRVEEDTQSSLKETIFHSKSVQDDRNLRVSKENRIRIPGQDSSHLTFSLSWPTESTSPE